MIRKKFFAVVFLGACSLSQIVSAEGPPLSIDLQSDEYSLISDSVIPIPIEVFAALDKMGSHDWNSQIHNRSFQPSADRSKSALLFGMAISQGFIAVQAKNSKEVLRVGQAVQKLAAPLGVRVAVEGRIKIILESMNDQDWEDVKQEFDKTRQTVLETMARLRDEDLATLVALGGWLGGTEALSGIIENEYSAESSDLLNQVDLLRQIQADFSNLSDSSKTDPVVFDRIKIVLANLESLMTTEQNGVVSQPNVSKIHKEAHSLVDVIHES